MLEGTRTVQIYVKAQGPADPRFGDEIDDDAVNDHAYAGWLPLTLSPADADGGRRHATVIGDRWLTTPGGAEAPPDPGPAPVRITAAECSAELHERARLGLLYFVEETPDERGKPYDPDMIQENIDEQIQTTLNALQKHREARAVFSHPDVRNVDVIIKELNMAGPTNTKGRPVPQLDEDGYRSVVVDFLIAHHGELVAYIEERIRGLRTRVGDLLLAAQRLGTLCD